MQPQTNLARPETESPAVGTSGQGLPGLRLSALQAANFAGIGIYMPFIPPWLVAQGLNELQVGLVLAMGMIIRMLASQPVTSLGDGRLGAVRVLVTLHMLGGFSFLALMIMPSPALIIAVMALIALLSSGIIPLGDHLTTAQVRINPALDFSRIRLWGSVAFLGVSIGSGLAVSRFGIGIVPPMLAACSFAAALIALTAPGDGHRWHAAGADAAPLPSSSLQARLLWLVIIASAMINASHAALYGFGTLHWRAIGIDDSMIGALWAFAVVAEIAVFWWFGRLAFKSFDAALLFLAISGIGAVVRFGLMPFAVSLPSILALQALHALSFSAQLMGVMALVSMLAPEGRRALIMGRLSAVNACMMGAATLGSGFVFAQFGPLVFLAMVPVAATGLALLAITFRLGHKAALDSTRDGTLPQGGAMPARGPAGHDGAA